MRARGNGAIPLTNSRQIDTIAANEEGSGEDDSHFLLTIGHGKTL
jgi:hypothetical protein